MKLGKPKTLQWAYDQSTDRHWADGYGYRFLVFQTDEGSPWSVHLHRTESLPNNAGLACVPGPPAYTEDFMDSLALCKQWAQCFEDVPPMRRPEDVARGAWARVARGEHSEDNNAEEACTSSGGRV